MLKIRSCPHFCRWEQLEISHINVYYNYLAVSQVAQRGFLGISNTNLALFSNPEVAIPSKMRMLELYHVMML